MLTILFGTILFNDLLPTVSNVDNSIVRVCSNNIVDGCMINEQCWTTLFRQDKSTWYHSCFVVSTIWKNDVWTSENSHVITGMDNVVSTILNKIDKTSCLSLYLFIISKPRMFYIFVYFMLLNQLNTLINTVEIIYLFPWRTYTGAKLKNKGHYTIISSWEKTVCIHIVLSCVHSCLPVIQSPVESLVKHFRPTSLFQDYKQLLLFRLSYNSLRLMWLSGQ